MNRESGVKRSLKVFRKSHMKESELSMFANEIKIVKGLDHPNIQRVYGVYEDEKRYYLVTDIC